MACRRTIAANELAALALLGLLASQAAVAQVVGTGQGSFASLSSCDSSGSDRDCRIVNTAANGANTQVQWGSQHRVTNFVNPSTLTAVDLNINTPANALGVRLGQLDWYNSSTLRLNNSLDVFNVRWTMALNFSAPSGPDPIGGEPFALTIRNPVNPMGDSIFGFQLADLNNLRNSFALGGVTFSNFRYQVFDGAGAGTSYLGLNSGGRFWYNDENNLSTLYVVADVAGMAAPIPEPETYAMMLAGLGMLVIARRRKRNAAARA